MSLSIWSQRKDIKSRERYCLYGMKMKIPVRQRVNGYVGDLLLAGAKVTVMEPTKLRRILPIPDIFFGLVPELDVEVFLEHLSLCAAQGWKSRSGYISGFKRCYMLHCLNSIVWVRPLCASFSGRHSMAADIAIPGRNIHVLKNAAKITGDLFEEDCSIFLKQKM